MRRVDPARCLDLDNDLGVHDEVGDIPPDHLTAKYDLERHFALDSVTGTAKRDRDGICIDPLEEPISELAMHFEEAPMIAREISACGKAADVAGRIACRGGDPL